MSAAALIRRLRERDIRLWTDGAKLRYSAPEGAMTEEIRAEVAKHRAELLAFLAAAEAANDDMPPLGRAPRGAPLPLSFAQERLWFLEQLVPDTGAYNVAKTIRFRGRLDIAALRGAFRTLAARHETLRTCFPSEDGRATQVVAETVAADLPIVDLAQLDPARRDPVARHLADSHARRAFDLRRGPLWHVLLLRLDDEEHVLSVVLHHIVFDGWSAGVLVAEIAESYRALTAGAAPNLPALPVQYADFAVWQRGWLRGERLDRELDFWRDRLAGAPPVLDLPADRRRTTVQSARGAVAVFAVDADGTAALRRLSRECGATLFMTLMTAFKVLLYRCCGQSDLVVGTPIANRRKSELERLIGFFVNMLAVRTDLGGNPSFVDALERVKSSLVDAYSHQDLPFEYLVKALGVPRDLSHAPVFQVAFQLQSARAEAIELPGLVLEQMETDDRTAKLDMTVSISEGERTLQGTVQASTDLFDRETIERLGSLYVRLLGAIAANPRIPIDGLPLLDRQEREAVLRASASPAKPVPALLQARFERLAQRTGDLVAVADRDFQLTYRELNEQAAYLARRLVAAGVRREQLIGICMPRSAETIVAMLGVLKAGAAFVPMDHTYPAERLARMIEDSRLRLVITNAAARAALPCGDYDSLALERGARADAASPAGRLAAELPGGLPAELPGGLAAELPTMEPQSLAYVIYTSGSTGMPKGALLQHDGAANFAARCIEQKLVGPHCRFMKFASIGFDASIAEVFITLNAGGCVCIVPDDARRSTDVLQDWAREQAATDAILPPTLVALLEPAAFRTMRMLTAGGEACGPEIANRWGRAARFFNAYGPTETSVGPVLGRVREVAPGERVPIGRPLANVSAYVVDRAFEVVPPGIVGEICIGGVAVGRGYLGRPDMTAEKFVPDPFGAAPGGRLYRTGDLGRYRRDGRLEFVGRIDDQVKIRGFRIEPAEIESALKTQPGVREAAVVARQDERGALRLVAYVVMHEGVCCDADALRTALRARVPDYMVPALIATLGALPTTSSGKVNRRALPAPRFDGGRPAVRRVRPRSPEEHTLARIWTDVLGVARVGVHDDFFALGGDSMKSIEVIARARQRGLGISPSDLFRNPTVAGLARIATPVDTGAERPDRHVPTGDVPLTPIQHWFFEQSFAAPHHWNWAFLRSVDEPLDPGLVERALGALLHHHDALRLRFERTGTLWRQHCVPPDGRAPFSVVDLSALGGPRRRAALEAAAQALQGSLDLAAGPLLRAAYFASGPAQADRMLIVLHHLVVDVFSARVLMEDFQAAYRQLEERRPEVRRYEARGPEAGALEPAVVLPPKTSSYRDWALALAAHADALPLRAELQHWADGARADVPRLPRDREGANTEASGDLVVRALDADSTHALLRDLPAEGAGIVDVLLTALVETIGAWTGQRAVRVDLEGHGREEVAAGVDVSRTVGWFTCIYPVTLDLRSRQAGRAALEHVAGQLARVPKGGIGFGLLRYLCSDPQVRELLGETPPAELNFNYLGRLDQALADAIPFRAAPESKGHERSPLGLRTYPLYVVASVRGGVLRVHWNYSCNLHARGTIERLADDYVGRLHDLAAECGRRAARA